METQLLATGGLTVSREVDKCWVLRDITKWGLLTPRSREQAAGGCAHASRALANAGGLDSGASCFPLSYPWVGWVAGADNGVGDYCILVHKPNFSLALEFPECR